MLDDLKDETPGLRTALIAGVVLLAGAVVVRMLGVILLFGRWALAERWAQKQLMRDPWAAARIQRRKEQWEHHGGRSQPLGATTFREDVTPEDYDKQRQAAGAAMATEHLDEAVMRELVDDIDLRQTAAEREWTP